MSKPPPVIQPHEIFWSSEQAVGALRRYAFDTKGYAWVLYTMLPEQQRRFHELIGTEAPEYGDDNLATISKNFNEVWAALSDKQIRQLDMEREIWVDQVVAHWDIIAIRSYDSTNGRFALRGENEEEEEEEEEF